MKTTKKVMYFMLTLILSAVSLITHAQTKAAKALWDDEKTTLIFVYDTNTYTVGNTYTIDGESYTVWEIYYFRLNRSTITSADYNYGAKNATHAVIAASFADAPLTSTSCMFGYMSKLAAISGME